MSTRQSRNEPLCGGCASQIRSSISTRRIIRAGNEWYCIWYYTRMNDHSGKFNVRIPSSLHQALVERANDEGVSLNHLVTALLAGGLGWSTSGSALRLTPSEVSALAYAAGSIGDDLDNVGMSAADKRAWHRGMNKLRSASSSAR